VDVDSEHLKAAIAAGGPDVKGINDFREVLARKDIDIVHIPTPTPLARAHLDLRRPKLERIFGARNR